MRFFDICCASASIESDPDMPDSEKAVIHRILGMIQASEQHLHDVFVFQAM